MVLIVHLALPVWMTPCAIHMTIGVELKVDTVMLLLGDVSAMRAQLLVPIVRYLETASKIVIVAAMGNAILQVELVSVGWEMLG